MHKKEMKTTVVPPPALPGSGFGAAPNYLENSFGGQSLGYDLSLCK